MKWFMWRCTQGYKLFKYCKYLCNPCLLWLFKKEDKIESWGADAIINHPSEIPALIKI